MKTDPSTNASDMTIREAFAMAALQGMCANPTLLNVKKEGEHSYADFSTGNMRAACMIADALISALNDNEGVTQ